VIMSTKFIHRLSCAIVLSLSSGLLHSLEVGFEISNVTAATDNVDQNNQGLEIEGAVNTSTLTIFGSQTSSRLSAGFLGELGGQRRFQSVLDDEASSITRFFGSIDLELTRQISWYFGAVLGGSLTDNAVAVTNETELLRNRRSVFLTGPELDLQFSSVQRLEGHLFSIANSDDDGSSLPDFLELELDYSHQLGGGLAWGATLDNIRAENSSTDPNFNRLTFGLTGSRTRNLNTWEGLIGGTQFDSDEGDAFETSGAIAQLRYRRQFSEINEVFAEVSRSIVDDTLSETNSLLTTGNARVAETPGVFNDTVFRIGQSYGSTITSFAWDVGFGDADFEGIVDGAGFTTAAAELQDQRRTFANLNFTRSLSPKFSVGFTFNYQFEEFLNLPDDSESFLGAATISYFFGDFRLNLTYQGELMDELDTMDGGREITDVVENQILIGLIFSPPTRAQREQVERLRTLL